MAWNTYTAQGQLKQLQVASPLAPMLPISDTLLGSAQASITVNVPSTYQHLYCVWTGRSDVAGVSTTAYLRINGDSAANYDMESIQASGAAVAGSESLASTAVRVGEIAGNTATAGNSGAGRIEIVDYTSTTFHKNVFSHGGFSQGTAAGNIFNIPMYGKWRSTAAVTSITLLPSSGNFMAGTRLTVYGLGVTTPNAIGVGAFTPPTYATTLPASPADGQQAILVDSTTNPTYQWLFRYNASSSSTYKWEFIGGSSKQGNYVDTNAVVNTKTQVGATGYYYDAAGGASFTVPRAGDYQVSGTVNVDPATGAVGDLFVGVFNGATIITTGWGRFQTTTSILSIPAGQQMFFGISASTVVGVAALAPVAGTNKLRQQWCVVTPVRVS